ATGPTPAPDCLPPRPPSALPTITASPTTPDNSLAPSWSFTGEGGATFECRLTRGATVVSDWSVCTSPDGYDLTGQPDGTYTFAVRATHPAGLPGPASTSDCL